MEPLEFVCFRDVNWMQAHGLAAENVLEYFALSQFYERTCNNAVLRMQHDRSDPGAAPLSGPALTSALDALSTGGEYVLDAAHSAPPRLYVILRRERRAPGPGGAVATDAYYVVDGCVYKAPDALAVLSGRLAASAAQMGRALDAVRAAAAYDVASGHYVRRIVDENTEDAVDRVLRAEECAIVDRILPPLL